MGVLATVEIGPLALFAAAALVVSVGVVYLSGFFPLSSRPAAARGPVGGALLVLGAGLVGALAIAGVQLAAEGLPWAVAVVAGGLAFLAAPFLVQPIPDRLRDTPAGLAAFAAAALAMSAALWFA